MSRCPSRSPPCGRWPPPPNAVVFGSGRLSVAEMMRAGGLVGLAAVLVITLVVFALAMPVLGFGWSV